MSTSPTFIREIPGGIQLAIKAQPRSSQSKILGPEGDFLKIKLQSPPLEGAANEALIELLQNFFSVPKKNIKIRRGEKSRWKWVEIQGLSPAKALARVLSPHKS